MHLRFVRRAAVIALLLTLAIVGSSAPVSADDAGFALSFDGVDDVVFLGDTSDAMGEDWDTTKTISLWLKPRGPAQGLTSDNTGEFIIGTDRPRIFGINRSNLGDGDRLRVWNSDGGPDTVAVDFTPDEWIHIAMVHAGGVLTVYKDGEMVGSISSGTTYAPRDGSLWIAGGQRTTPASFFGGEIDEVQFWSAALDQATIQAWMYRELDTNHPNWADLRAYYRMSDGVGTALTDDSGQGVTGQLRGGMSDGNWVPSGAFGSAPDTIPPVAQPQSLSTDEDIALPVTLTATDEDGDDELLTYAVVSGPGNGTLTGTPPNLTYTPNANFNGSDTIEFVANDGLVDSAPATVEIAVIPVNDPPDAVDDVVSVQQDTAGVFEVLANDSDIDGDGLTVTGVGAAANGIVVNNGIDVTYTPNAGYVGVDSFTYTVDDGNGGGDTATVTVDVRRVNQVPVANGQAVVTDEDVPLPVPLTASDGDGDALTYRVTSGPSNGALSGTHANLTYTPNANYNGSDSFTFVVNDGFVDSAPATVDIMINAVNDAPDAFDDTSSIDQDSSAVIDVLANDTDIDGDALAIVSVGAAPNGVVANNGTDITYTPNTGYVGPDSFSYTVQDGTGAEDSAIVNVDVREASAAGFALRFDGSNDFVRVAPTASVFGPGWESSKSVTLWVKPMGVSERPQNPTPAFCDAVIGDRPRWWGISRCELNGADRLWIWNYDGNFDGLGVPYTPGEWTQIGFVHDGGQLIAYKNGDAVGSIPSGATIQPPGVAYLQYGGVINNASRNWSFEGEIDEVRVWSGARSAGEIAADLLRPLAGSEPGLATYYQMSDGAGVTVTDNSGHGWIGELNDGLLPHVQPDGPIEWVASGAMSLPSFAAAYANETVVLQVDFVSLVDVAEFTVQANGDAAVASWTTYSEFRNQGFNVYRASSAEGPYELITTELIRSVAGDEGATYQFTDRPGDGAFYYILEDVNEDGVATRRDPIRVTMGGASSDSPALFLPSLLR